MLLKRLLYRLIRNLMLILQIMSAKMNFMVFRLDALALSVIATATWLAGWLGGWLGVRHSRYCIKTTKPIRKLFGPSGRPII